MVFNSFRKKIFRYNVCNQLLKSQIFQHLCFFTDKLNYFFNISKLVQLFFYAESCFVTNLAPKPWLQFSLEMEILSKIYAIIMMLHNNISHTIHGNVKACSQFLEIEIRQGTR